MQVQNVECQLAQAQIGRYLTGEGFSGEMLRQLEDHIRECETCRDILAERKKSLQSMLTGQDSGDAGAWTPEEPVRRRFSQAVVHARAANSETSEVAPPEEEPASKPTLLQLLQQKANDLKTEQAPDTSVEKKLEAPATPSSFWKPLAYSGFLALVLFGMGYFVKGNGSILGKKAAETLPVTSSQAESTSDDVKIEDVKSAPEVKAEDTGGETTAILSGDTESAAATSTQKQETTEKPEPAKPEATKPAAAVKPKTPKATSTNAAKKKTTTSAARRTGSTRRTNSTRRTGSSTKRGGNSIKVYDANGRPIN